jgi:hypothetical protein
MRLRWRDVGIALGAVGGLASSGACGSNRPSGFDPSENGGSADGGGSEVGAFVDNRDASHECVNLECQQQTCSGGGDTTLTGTVYAPNGTLPIYNVVVYVPNGPLQDIPRGTTCDQCGAVSSGNPLVTALSDAKGQFVLHNVPAGTDIPLVIQVGKWRRQTTIREVKACQDNKIGDRNLTRLPRNQKEGNMPHIALTTGGYDNIGCMLPKIGIDPAEFGFEADGFSKAINIYNGLNQNPYAVTGLPQATDASGLWGNFAKLKDYDMAIFSCEGNEAPMSKGSYGSPAFGEVTKYLDAGGRIFTTDFQYTWYRYSPDPGLGATNPSNLAQDGIGTITGNAPDGANPMTLDTTFPKGKALADWLANVFPSTTYGEVTMDWVFANLGSVAPDRAQVWANSAGMMGGPDGNGTAGPRIFTVNMPVGKPVDKQCGKGVHIDAHITQPGRSADNVGPGYPGTCGLPLKQDEAMLAFFFFDLASCIQKESDQPKAPPPK